RLHAAGDCDADGIEDADLGPMHRLRGQILEPQCGGSAGKFVCELHAAPPAPASRAKTVRGHDAAAARIAQVEQLIEDFASRIGSGTVLAGTDGSTTMTLGTRVSPATGAMSRM